ncbi:hypothetical protein Vadar_004338 [Vaccinium darrowii]|uniref:Uncharacterized protein n=1 Tax=Vaccinium darrowii TaxID=229202 RepID=A0ACB7YBW0_9ERIC|nr:hypothetical protein Vadar_004338 [Vaccinium darrowii]
MADTKSSTAVMADPNSSTAAKPSSNFFDMQIMTNTAEHRRRKERENRKQGKKDKFWKYTPLLIAALKGDWETANKFFEQNPNAVTAPITRELETALYMATGTGKKAIKFGVELLKLMPAEDIAQRDIDETLSFLLEASYKDDAAARTLFFTCSRTEPSGAELLIHVITSGFYDLALDLVHRYPQLAISQARDNDDCALGAIARKASAFSSGKHLKFFWDRIIYADVPVPSENYVEDLNRVEIENPVEIEYPVQKYHRARFVGITFFISEDDFLYVLPKRLIAGLVTLFLSITTMMVAFSFSLYLVLGHKKAWILVSVAALACLPVTSFVSL